MKQQSSDCCPSVDRDLHTADVASSEPDPSFKRTISTAHEATLRPCEVTKDKRDTC